MPPWRSKHHENFCTPNIRLHTRSRIGNSYAFGEWRCWKPVRGGQSSKRPSRAYSRLCARLMTAQKVHSKLLATPLQRDLVEDLSHSQAWIVWHLLCFILTQDSYLWHFSVQYTKYHSYRYWKSYHLALKKMPRICLDPGEKSGRIFDSARLAFTR